MHTLNKKQSITTPHVMVCTEKRLLGDCHKFELGDYKKNQMEGWSGKIQSIYVARKNIYYTSILVHL